jgi:hypothetical protein
VLHLSAQTLKLARVLGVPTVWMNLNTPLESVKAATSFALTTAWITTMSQRMLAALKTPKEA